MRTNLKHSGSYDVFPERSTETNPTKKPWHVDRNGDRHWLPESSTSVRPMLLSNSAVAQSPTLRRSQSSYYLQQSQRPRPLGLQKVVTPVIVEGPLVISQTTLNKRANPVRNILAMMLPSESERNMKRNIKQCIVNSQNALSYHSNPRQDKPNDLRLKTTTSNGSLFVSRFDRSRSFYIQEGTIKVLRDKFFASDVALKHLAIFYGRSSSVAPKQLPHYIVRESISNGHTNGVINSIMERFQKRDELSLGSIKRGLIQFIIMHY